MSWPDASANPCIATLRPLPAMMRAVEAGRPGGSDVLVVVERPRPEPGPGEVLIQVAAAGVNRADVMQREGRYEPPEGTDTKVLGLECSGSVVAVGEGVAAAHLGRPVCALLSGGGYAEFVRVPVAQTARVPDGMSWVDAASLPEVAATVWSNLVVRGRLAAGERVLVHGGTSGVGSMAIQIAAALGATVTATVSTPEKVDFCHQLGATRVLVRHQDDFARTLSQSIDVVLDIVGAPYLGSNIAVMRREGRLVQVGLLGGAIGSIDLTALLERNLTITGSGLRTRPVAEKGKIVAALEQQLWPYIQDGTVRPVVAAIFPLLEVRQAHDLLESGRLLGKVVLEINPLPNSRTDESGQA